MTEKQPSRPWRWLRRVIVLGLVIAVVAVMLRASLPGYVRGWLTDLLAEQLNIDLSVDDIDIDLRAGHVILTGVTAELDGEPLAKIPRVDADLDPLALLRGEGGTISLKFERLEGSIRLDEGGALSLGRIGPRNPPDEDAAPPAEPHARIALDMEAPDAVIHYSDPVTDPSRPVTFDLVHARIAATQVLVDGPDLGASLMDVRLLGAVHQDVGPALLAAGFWEGLGEKGRYLELHAALTGFDIRTIPQYVTPKAATALGGDIFHASGTAVAHHGTIEQGLIRIEVEDSSSDLDLRFGGPIDAPVFDVGSPVLEVFRLSYLRVTDSGSSLLSEGKGFGKTLWDRSSGLVVNTAGGLSSAVTEFSLKRLGEGIWKGVTGLFKGESEDDRAERIKRWAGFAQRQLAFRALFMQRRIDVAKELEPDRVPEFERLLASEGWKQDLDALIPDDARPDAEK